MRLISGFGLILKGCCLEALEGTTELVGAGGALGAAADAVELTDHIVDALATDQLADALQIAIAAAQKKHLLDDVVLIGCHVDQLRACTDGFVLNMLCLHISLLFCHTDLTDLCDIIISV